MFDWLKHLLGSRPRAQVMRRPIRGRYDAAATNEDNRRHWANADALGSREANNLTVRKGIRERARYEVANNSYAKGIVLTLANNLIGPGPRLQVSTADTDLNQRVEAAFAAWSAVIRFADQLRTMKGAKTTDGEAVGLLVANPGLPSPVQLDLRLVECDQLTDPGFTAYSEVDYVDGIRFDALGNPVTYDVLRYHPGDLVGSYGEYDTVPASRVVHWFRADRPGQVRGISELTAGLPLFAQLRRFTLATLTAAETAAMFAALIKTQSGPNTTDLPDGEVQAFETEEIERGLMTFLPAGYEAAQLKAEHPATTYDMFVTLLIREIARCLNMPWNLAAGDSSKANYSSARLDHLIYRAAVTVERQDCEREVLDPIFAAWLREAVLISGYLPPGVRAFASLPHAWRWPAWEYLDPLTEAQADTERLTNGTTTLAEVCAQRGEDWREVKAQQEVEANWGKDPNAVGIPQTGDVQGAALNGLQITSLLGVLDKLVLGQYPPSTVEYVLQVAFPDVAIETIRQLVRSVEGFTPAVLPDQAAATPSAVAAQPVLSIQAASPTKALRILGGAGSVQIQGLASGRDAGPPTFEMLAYTGGKLSLDNFSHPVVIDLAGLEIPSQHRPAFRDHQRWKLVGHTESILNDGRQLTATGRISGTGQHAREVRETARNGFRWQVSVGAVSEVVEFIGEGQTVEVNAQQFAGPVYVARKSRLDEISFVPLGADGNTAAAIAAGVTEMNFEQWCLGFMDAEAFAALTDEAKAALQMAFDHMNQGETETETDPGMADESGAVAPPEMPAAAGVAATARAATVRTTRRPRRVAAVQAAQSEADIQATIRRTMAAEEVRVQAIRRICAPVPDATIQANGRSVSLLEHAIATGRSADQVELDVLRIERSQGPHIHIARGASPVTGLTIEAALCRVLRIKDREKQFKPEVLEAADKQFPTIGLQQFLLMAAAQTGYHAGPGQRITTANLRTVMQHCFPAQAFGGSQRIEAGWTPLSVPGVLSNVANKEILQGYMEEDQAWREISTIKTVPDFKAMTSYRLLDSLSYEEVGAGGEIKHGKLDEESYTRQAKTYAKMLGLTRTDIINDDLGAFDDIKTRLGRGAGQKLNSVFWTEFLSDASTFWTSTRTNYITGATTTLLTDGVGMALGVKAFRQMLTPSSDGSKRVGGSPEILLVPPELEYAAEVLHQSGNANVGSGPGEDNIYRGKYRPVVAAQLSDSAFTGYSTTAWYLLRSPSIAPAICVSFLNGMQTPTVEDAEADFNVLGIQFRGYHDFGCDQAEYLCGVKSKGAA